MLSKVRGDTVPLLVSLAWLRISTTSCSGRTVHASQPCALVHLACLSLFFCFVLAQNGVVLVHYKAKWHHLDVWFVKKAWANDVIFTISNKPYEPPLSKWGLYLPGVKVQHNMHRRFHGQQKKKMSHTWINSPTVSGASQLHAFVSLFSVFLSHYFMISLLYLVFFLA